MVYGIENLTLKSKQIVIDAGEFELCFNFAEVLKGADDLYINATSFSKDSGAGKNAVRDFLKNISTIATIKAIEKYDSNLTHLGTVRRETFYRKSGRYGGTWMCKLLFLDFARWVNPDFGVLCNKILLQVFEQAGELSSSRAELRKIQIPLNDQIKKHLVDPGLKNDSAYIQFATMIKRMVGAPDERDTYTADQLTAAKRSVEEYRGMIVYGKMTSLKEMNTILIDSPHNLAWRKE